MADFLREPGDERGVAIAARDGERAQRRGLGLELSADDTGSGARRCFVGAGAALEHADARAAARQRERGGGADDAGADDQGVDRRHLWITTVVPSSTLMPCHSAGTAGSVNLNTRSASAGERFTQ